MESSPHVVHAPHASPATAHSGAATPRGWAVPVAWLSPRRSGDAYETGSESERSARLAGGADVRAPAQHAMPHPPPEAGNATEALLERLACEMDVVGGCFLRALRAAPPHVPHTPLFTPLNAAICTLMLFWRVGLISSDSKSLLTWWIGWIVSTDSSVAAQDAWSVSAAVWRRGCGAHHALRVGRPIGRARARHGRSLALLQLTAPALLGAYRHRPHAPHDTT